MRSLLFGKVPLRSAAEVKEYERAAEEEVVREEKRQKEVRERYLQRSAAGSTRKRSREERESESE